jgi:hypothetical protein
MLSLYPVVIRGVVCESHEKKMMPRRQNFETSAVAS